MERRNNGTGRIQLPEPERMDARKHTRKETTIRPNNSQGHHTSTVKTHKELGCKTSLEKKLKLETEIPWREIGRNIVHGILGTKEDELMVQKHTTPRATYLLSKRNNHNHSRTMRGTFCGRSCTKTGTTSGNVQNTSQYSKT